jgi:uncharacterized membrane protein
MRILGHPLHAVVVAFPLGLLALVPLWDALAWLGVSGAASASYLGEIAGLVGGLLAVVTGTIDFVRARKSPAIEKLAIWHGGAALTTLSVFATALVLRSSDHSANTSSFIFEAAGALCLGVTGWCGGHLVFHHGVAVRESSSVAADEQTIVRKRPIDRPSTRRHVHFRHSS